jgi:CBS domain-containing protein
MKISIKIAVLTSAMVAASAVFAEDVQLPAPVLQWSFYVFLIFALVVGLGIFFVRNKKEVTDEPLSNLIEEPDSMTHSVGPYTSVVDCVQQMNELKIGAMLVMDDKQLVGIFTERDCLTKVVGAWLDPKTTKVGEVMTKDPYCVSPATSLEEAMNIISNQRFRHLPVVENGKVLGVVSSGDLTHRLVKDRSIEVRDLVRTAGRRRASL